jgi:TRAP-type uncharacterized transport system fused permease subunit
VRVSNIPPVPTEIIPPLRQVLRDVWYFPIPFSVLVGTVLFLNKSPAEAAMWATLALIGMNTAFAYKGHRIRLADRWHALMQTGNGCVEIIVIGAVAGLMTGILQVTGLGFGLTYLLVSFGHGNLFLLLLVTAVICIVLGMGMPTTGIYLLVATLAAPPLLELGVQPMAAHFFIFYFGMLSMISPPVAVAAFAAASIAGASAMQTALTSVRIGWPAFILPFLFVYSPSLLLQGGVGESLIAVVTEIAGVWLISIVIAGYFSEPLDRIGRIWALIAGAMVLIPSGAFAHAAWVEAIGTGLAVAWVLFIRRKGAQGKILPKLD